MWWILGACLGTGVAALELGRFLRGRAADRRAPRRYALYHASDPERALAIVEIGPDDPPQPVPGAPAAPPPDGADDPPPAGRDESITGAGARAAAGLPPYARRRHPPTSGGRRG